MSESEAPRRSRRGLLIGVLIAVIVVAGIVVSVVLSGMGDRSSAPTPSASDTIGPQPTATPTLIDPSGTASPTPQPTRTAAIESPAPIVGELTARVSRTEAVRGTASGPGEIAGPSVRFTVVITNGSSESVDLSNTVVNVYSGRRDDPALELSGPGVRSLPARVAAGDSATGVFVFSIPRSQRGDVTVTIDTAVGNPVVAFEGDVS